LHNIDRVSFFNRPDFGKPRSRESIPNTCLRWLRATLPSTVSWLRALVVSEEPRNTGRRETVESSEADVEWGRVKEKSEAADGGPEAWVSFFT
jgi:hypothetical protein